MYKTRNFISDNKTTFALIGILTLLLSYLAIFDSGYLESPDKRLEKYREKVLESPYYYVDEGTYQTTEELFTAKTNINKFGVSEITYEKYAERNIDFEFTSQGLKIDYPYKWQDLALAFKKYNNVFLSIENKKYSHVQEVIKFNPVFTRRIPDSIDEPTTIYEISIDEWYINDMESNEVIVDVLNNYTDTNTQPTLVLYCNKDWPSVLAFDFFGRGIHRRLLKYSLENMKPVKHAKNQKNIPTLASSPPETIRGFMTVDEDKLIFENMHAYDSGRIPDYHQRCKLAKRF